MSSESRRFPLDLGKSSISDPPRPGISDPPRMGNKATLLSPVPARRTSSLPSGSPGPEVIPPVPQRTPSPSPGAAHDTSLLPPRTVSRTSSTSSRRRTRILENSETYAALSAAPLGSPLIVSNGKCGDFNSPHDQADATIRGKPREGAISPHSVRLVSSPHPETVLSTSLVPLEHTNDSEPRSTFSATSPWGAQSPQRDSANSDRLDDPLEYVYTPVTPNLNNCEDDNEKGRRLACEFLEDDFRHVHMEKVAMFLGGP